MEFVVEKVLSHSGDERSLRQCHSKSNGLIMMTIIIHGSCGRTGYTGPTGRTGPSPDPSDPTAYCTHTSLAQLLASSSLLVEDILASSLEPVTN